MKYCNKPRRNDVPEFHGFRGHCAFLLSFLLVMYSQISEE